MCKLEYLSHILRKRSTQIYAIWVNLNSNQIIWGLNYIAFRVVFQEIYAAERKIYATAGRTGRLTAGNTGVVLWVILVLVMRVGLGGIKVDTKNCTRVCTRGGTSSGT